MTDEAHEAEAAAAPHAFHALTADEVLALLQVEPAKGLSADTVATRLHQHGRNETLAARHIGAFEIFLHQLQGPVVLLLAVAAVLSAIFGEWIEALAILVVLFINTLIGFITEIRAVRSLEALRALGQRTARVRRDGRIALVAAAELVPGDIVLLEAGDAVPGDVRLIEASGLAADESTLTGESVPVAKTIDPVPTDALLGDRSTMLFKGTMVTRGSGVGVTVATGLQSELGRITALVAEAEPGTSPLERRLARLSGQLVWVTLAIAVILLAVGIATGRDILMMIESSIALAVAAIPEGLPIVATLALARSMWRMARQNALIEQLSAVETLGATTLILTDKTGTLTENRMTVRALWPAGAAENIALPFAGPVPDGLSALLEAGVLCNDASLGTGESDDSGDPMELALLRAGHEAGFRQDALLASAPIATKHAFDTSTRMMATVHAGPGGYQFAIKGAPEAVLAASSQQQGPTGPVPLDDEARAMWQERISALGQRGLRVLAAATKQADSVADDPYAGLVFAGLLALEDPARADVPAAVAACHEAGIRVVMVTGDHAVTARAIAEAVGLGEAASRVAEGRDVAQLVAGPADELRSIGVFSRVSPAEKLELVKAFQAAGEIVAMTGDGVNDAPALKQADIGVAMGKRGTDVAREAADMVLLDDAFATIVKAVREGRIILGNIRRFVAYLLSCNLSEVLVVGLAVLTALPLPILPLQILYLNLVTDVFPAFALAMGEGERGILKRPPRAPGEPILGKLEWETIIWGGLTLAAGTFGAMAAAEFWLGLDEQGSVTVTFLTLAFCQLWHVFNMEDARSGLFVNEVTANPWVWAALGLCTLLLALPPYIPPLAAVLGLVPPTAAMWGIILLMSFLPVLPLPLFRLLRKALSKQDQRLRG